MYKKIGFIAGILVLAYFFIVILKYASIAFLGDYSLQPVHTPPNHSPNKRPPVYLISYADGPSYYLQNQNAMVSSAINKGIDFIYSFRRPHLSPEFLKKHEALFAKYGPNGLWLWKPYLINKMLSEIPEGAYLIYLDANFIFKKPITPLLKALEQNDLILTEAFGVSQKMGQYVKGDVFKEVGCLKEECRSLPVFAGGALFIKNTPTSRAFVKEWFSLCEKEYLLSNEQSEYPNFPEFDFHFHDLAILSALYHVKKPKAKILTMEDLYAYVFWTHRKGSAKKLKPYYTLYGVRDTSSFRKSGSALTSMSILNFPPLVRIRKWIYSALYK